MKKYISAKEAFYDYDRMLYYCYIGYDDNGKTLKFAAFGNSYTAVIQAAAGLAELLNMWEERNQVIKSN